MKIFAAIVSSLVFAAVVLAQIEEKPISASGIVSLEIFPGPPNYESIKDGDAREEAWILTTSKKERFQLVIIDESAKKFATLRILLGKKAAVVGTVWEAHTGHHHTPFLIAVASVQKEPNQSSEPTR